MPFLKHDIRSAFSPQRLYGKAGEEVKITSGDGTVLIVQGKGGNSFPVLITDFADQPDFIPAQVSYKPDPDPPPARKTRTRAPESEKNQNNQQSLF